MTGKASSVTPRPALLQLATAIAVPETRLEAAQALAREFGGRDLLLFLRDREVGLMLPAPGFPQSLPNGRIWTSFLEAAVRHGRLAGQLPYDGPDRLSPVFALAFGQDVAAVIVGVEAPAADAEWFQLLMPLYASIFGAERAAAAARVQEAMARESAARAAMLTQTVDGIRRRLETALAESREARAKLVAANEALAANAIQLNDVNDRLQTQAGQLASQSKELQTQKDTLQQTVKQLQHAREAADAANQAKSEFLATMSHELRTPLNAIAGHLQLVDIGVYGDINAEQRQALHRIDRNQRHLLGLINNILNLSRIEAGRLEYQIVDVDLAEALADLRPMIEPQLRVKSLAYEVRDPETMPVVRADRDKLQQILLNLLSNAVKFTDRDGKIRVDCVQLPRTRGQVHVRVTDNGRGIPRDKLEMIFEPFRQVNATHSRGEQGAGLGLAISRDLARGMGGDLRARSDPGHGSVFTLTLPIGSTDSRS